MIGGANAHGLSNALGWVSIACWIVVYSPQIVENYTLQSGEGLSVIFVVTWLLGDLCNLVGAGMAGLQATVIILAIYYSICDIVLLFQIYYYRRKYPDGVGRPTGSQRPTSRPAVVVQDENGENEPLLSPRLDSAELETQRKEEKTEGSGVLGACLKYFGALTFVCAVGALAWYLSKGADEMDNGSARGGKAKDVIEWRSQLIGWMSALLYLGSRIPQIMKNTETRCEGLSLALFMFAIVGNVTYVLSICVESTDARHLVANASWLAGSGGTIFLDLIVLCQFVCYRGTC